MKKLREDWSQGMLAIFRCRVFFIHFAIQKYEDQDIQNYNFNWFFMGVKLGLSYWRKDIGCGCPRIGCWETFRRKKDEVTREWRRLHIDELYELYWLANIIRVIKWRSMRWAGRVACIGKRKGTLSFWLGDNLEYEGWNFNSGNYLFTNDTK